MQVVYASEANTGYDVVTNSGYLTEAFGLIQQGGITLAGALREQGFSLVPYDGQPVNSEIKASIIYDGCRCCVTENGGLHYKADGDWHECLIAPGA